MDLARIYKVGRDSAEGSSAATYVMRGMIVYYGRHYYAYFYSQKFDSWF